MLTLRGPKGVRRGAALRDLGIIEDGSVLIRDGVVVEVGSTRRIENLKEARAAIEIPANGRIISPGFVDANLSLSLYHPHQPHKPSKRKSMGDFYDSCLALLRSCLQHGTLTADVKASAAHLDPHLSLSMIRKLAEIGTNPIFTVRTWHLGTGEGQSESELIAVLAVMVKRKLIRFIEFTHRSDSSIESQLAAVVADSEVGVKLAWPGGNTEELYQCLHLFNPLAVYCLAPSSLNSAEIAMLATALSTSVLAVGRGVFEGHISRVGRNLIDAGAAIALSSGYDSESAASYSMQMSLALAVFRLGLTPEEAFSAATINGAYAAGRGETTGSLEVGKQADVLLLNVPDYREVPSQFGVNHVDMALRDGNIVLNRTRWKAMHN